MEGLEPEVPDSFRGTVLGAIRDLPVMPISAPARAIGVEQPDFRADNYSAALWIARPDTARREREDERQATRRRRRAPARRP